MKSKHSINLKVPDMKNDNRLTRACFFNEFAYPEEHKLRLKIKLQPISVNFKIRVILHFL